MKRRPTMAMLISTVAAGQMGFGRGWEFSKQSGHPTPNRKGRLKRKLAKQKKRK